MFVIHDARGFICDNDTVSGAEAILDKLGVVEPLFNQDNLVWAGFLVIFDQLHNKGWIAIDAFLHI